MHLGRARRMPFQRTSTPKRIARSWLKSCRSGKAVRLELSIVSFCNVVTLAELHVLVNNSGSNWAAPYDEYPSAGWNRVLTLNLHRVFTITQLLTPLLERAAAPNDPARVINIGSVDGIRVPAHETFAYSASKAGLHHMSRVLAHHLGKRNITCVSVTSAFMVLG